MRKANHMWRVKALVRRYNCFLTGGGDPWQ
jgi:hypothetical protein